MSENKASVKLPDGPESPPFVQLIQWLTDPLKFMDRCAERYGDIFTVRLGSAPPSVFLSNPQAIQEIFTSDSEQFETGKGNNIIRPWVGKHSIVVVDGDRHRRQRQLLMPPFHGERMRTYGQLICGIAEQVMSQWTLGKPFSPRSSMQEISMRVIFQAVFGLHEGERFRQLSQLISSVLSVGGSPVSAPLVFFKALQKDLGPWSPWGRFLREMQQIDELLYAEFKERREQLDATRTDILSLLMAARDEDGQSMTDAELRDELMTLVIAGHETTAIGLTWALYWIHRLPDVKNKLLKELECLGDNPDPTEIAQLPYLSAVCQETLRIYPPLMLTFPRIAQSPVEIMGYQFDRGTMLFPSIYLTHRREDLYPQPLCFKPERFLERQFSPYEYLPFGGGHRRCVGMAFATFELKLVLATILSRVQLAIATNTPVRPVRRRISVAPSGGKWLVATGQGSSLAKTYDMALRN